MKCCFCRLDAGRYGNNPSPLRQTGRCCDVCNERYVIPTRLVQRIKRDKGK